MPVLGADIKRGCLERSCLWRAGIEASQLGAFLCHVLLALPFKQTSPLLLSACYSSTFPSSLLLLLQATLSLGARRTKPILTPHGQEKTGEVLSATRKHQILQTLPAKQQLQHSPGGTGHK